MRRVATKVQGPIAKESGPFVPEDDPELTARAIPGHVERCA